MDKNKFHIYTKTIIFCIFPLFSLSIFSQTVGVNVTKPQGVFHVDSKGNNSESTNPTPIQQQDDFIITADGNTGIGTINPNTKLQIVSNKDPLQIEGLQDGDFLKNNFLVLDENNLIKKAPSLEKLSLLIPFPAIFTLETDLINFLENSKAGSSEIVPMTLNKNAIDGLTFDEKKSTITLLAGTYQFSFNYYASHPEIKGTCFISSYFVDFPSDSNSTERISSTSPHGITQESSIHYGSLNYTVMLPSNTTWEIKLGRGDAGNCFNKDMTLIKDATQLIIYKIG